MYISYVYEVNDISYQSLHSAYPKMGKFTIGGVTPDRRKLLSLVSQQSTIIITPYVSQ
jgi:hypothetical protein